MKRNVVHAFSLAAIIIFTCAAVLCPIGLEAKQKKRQPKQEQARQEQKAAAEEKQESAGESRAAQDGNEAGEVAQDKEAAKESTEGVPTKDFKEDDFKPQVDEPSAVWMFIKMIFVLGIFGGGFFYFWRFITKKSGIGLFGGEAIKVLSVAPLGQNKYLQVVDLAGKVLVIGVSDNAISLISEITEKDQIDRIRILSNRAPSADRKVSGFQEYVMNDIGKLIDKVRELRHRDRGARTTVIDNPEDIKYLRQQRDRLKDLNGSDHE
ncbi:MAG: flagellar biosynthetic protein FliO [Spirochaetes bacterium]|nr:flagellar biosynthetic protein FliO [Spirochaetota bacterium]